MSTGAVDVRLVTQTPALLHGGRYVHHGVPRQSVFQMVSNSFQTSGESNKAPAAIPKGIHLHANQLRYHASNAADTNLHDEPPNGRQKIVRVENIPERLVRLPITECPVIVARRSTSQYERTDQQIQTERYVVYHNGHHLANETECLSEKGVVHLKPSGYQTQATSIPVTTGNSVYLAFSDIQSSNTVQMGARYPVNIQNPRIPNTAGELRHHSHPSGPNPARVAHDAFLERGDNDIYTPSNAPPSGFIHSHPRGNRYSVLESEPGVSSVMRQPPNVLVPNGVQPTLPFSYSKVPSGPHVLGGSNRLPRQQLVPVVPSASTFRIKASSAAASGSIHDSAIPAASPVNPHHPEENNPLSRGEYQKDPNFTKRHLHCETPKYVSAALPVHPMNAVPTDNHLVSHSPAHQLSVYRQKEPIGDRSYKAHFPHHIVYVPANGASFVSGPMPLDTGDVHGQSCLAEVYNTREARQQASISTSQSFKVNGGAQYSTGYASASHSGGPSPVNVPEGLTKFPIQYPYRPGYERSCRPVGGEYSAQNHRIDLTSSVHHDTPPYSKSNVMMAAHPSPNYATQAISQPTSAQVLTTSNPHFGSMNGHVPAESNNISFSENSAFHKIVHYQDAGKDRNGHHSVVNSWIVPEQQQHNNNSDDSFKPSYGRPSSWSNNISSHTLPHIRRDHPSIPRVCDSLIATQEPRCYISVDSKPPVDNEKEQLKFHETPRKHQEIVQSHQAKIPGIVQEQPDNKLEKLTKFVVGVETKIQWNKINNNNKKKSNGSEVKDMQIVSVSSTHSPRDDSTKTPSNSSGSESEDPVCMIRLERVYYSANAIPSRHSQNSAISEKQVSKLCTCDVDVQRKKLASLPGETQQAISNSGYSSKQTNFVPQAFSSKTSRDLSAVKKGRKSSYVPAASSVKRKANVSSGINDGVCSVKRKKMEKTKSTVTPKRTVITELGNVKTSLEILSTKDLTVQLDASKNACLEDVKQASERKERRIVCQRIRKRCTRKVRINS
ncbi:hypothetical protein ACROYT_G007130 [Oculina patagonica]